MSRQPFDKVLTSPLKRAFDTCRLAGFGDRAVIDPGLREWDYGDYEGKKTDEIRRDRPGWQIWNYGVPGGESIDDVANRSRSALQRILQSKGRVLVFSHGHFLRILTAAWFGLPPDAARYFALDAGSISILGHERETRVIRLWNLNPKGMIPL